MTTIDKLKKLNFKILNKLTSNYDYEIRGNNYHFDGIVNVAEYIKKKNNIEDDFTLVDFKGIPNEVVYKLFKSESILEPILSLRDKKLLIRGSIIFKYSPKIYLLTITFRNKHDFGYATFLLVFGNKNKFKETMLDFYAKCIDTELECREEKRNKHIKEHGKIFDKIFLANNIGNKITTEIDNFLNSEKLYREELCISWKRGIVLHGPPGNGKTTMIRAIREYYGFRTTDVADCIDSNGEVVFDECEGEHDQPSASIKVLANILYPEKRMPHLYYIEDIDKFVATQSNDSPQIALRNILKALDGVDSVNGVLIIATTNYIDNVAEALIARPGRFDSIYQIDTPTVEQIDGLLKYHKIGISNGGYETTYIAEKLKGTSMAFAEELVKLLKSRYKKNIVTLEEINDILDSMQEHRKRYSDMWTKVGF